MSSPRRNRSARLFGLVALSIVALMVAALGTRTAGAQTPGSVELVAQSSWVDDGGIFNIQVRVAGASPDSTVVLRVHAPWTNRSDFLEQVLDPEGEVLLELPPVVLGDAQDTTNEVLGLELLIDGPNTRRATPIVTTVGNSAQRTDSDDQPFAVLTSDGGSAVYPIEVLLLDSEGGLTDQFLTSMIELPRQENSAPLDVSVVLAANAPSNATPQTSTQLDDEILSRLDVISRAFAQHSNANMALSISPETLLSLSRTDTSESNEIIERLRSNLSSEQVLPNPLIDVEEQAWFDAELGDDLVELYEAGSNASIRAIGIEPEPSVMLLDPTVDGSGLDDIGDLGVQGLILSPTQVTPLDQEIFPQALTTSFLVAAESDDVIPIPALVADPGLTEHFTNSGAPVLTANRMLADLVLLSLQNSGGRQSVVVYPPEDWEPDAAFLNVFLSGLERIPTIQGSSPLRALAETEITPSLGVGTLSGPLLRQLDPPVSPNSLRSFRTEFSQARNAIDSWSTVIGDDNESRERLDELLFLSADQRLTQPERDGFIEAVYSLIDTQKDSSITTPAAETITLTGRESVVPIVVENRLSTNATVLMLLSSDELDFPEGSEIVRSLTPGPNRIEIPIVARASGDSPIQIQVLSPDGLVSLGSTEVLIRTFAFSGVGIAIGAVAIIVLLVWWLRQPRGERKEQIKSSNEESNEVQEEEVIGV